MTKKSSVFDPELVESAKKHADFVKALEKGAREVDKKFKNEETEKKFEKTLNSF